MVVNNDTIQPGHCFTPVADYLHCTADENCIGGRCTGSPGSTGRCWTLEAAQPGHTCVAMDHCLHQDCFLDSADPDGLTQAIGRCRCRSHTDCTRDRLSKDSPFGPWYAEGAEVWCNPPGDQKCNADDECEIGRCRDGVCAKCNAEPGAPSPGGKCLPKVADGEDCCADMTMCKGKACMGAYQDDDVGWCGGVAEIQQQAEIQKAAEAHKLSEGALGEVPAESGLEGIGGKVPHGGGGGLW